METHRTHSFKVYVRKNGHERIDDALRLMCSLYNAALEDWIKAYNGGCEPSENVGLYDQYKALTLIRCYKPEYAALAIQLERGALKRLDLARQSFFRRVREGEKPGFPRFKSWRRYNTLEIYDVSYGMFKRSPDGKKLFVKVKGLPVLRLKNKRDLPDGKPVTIKITRRPTGLFAHLAFAVETESDADVAGRPAVGIDMGVSKSLALSDGSVVQQTERDWRKRRRLQRAVSRSYKGSVTRKKRVKSLARFLYREVVSRRNEAHRITTTLVRLYGKIALEDLQIPNMTARAHDTGVSQKRGLNRRILEQGWGMITEQLKYKAESAGVSLLFVNPAYTSRTCSVCETVEYGKFREYALFECGGCGLVMDRDLNAARVILRRAEISVLAA